ncbi:MAG: hypothetical protein K0S45_4600 [Nitrospira sp.]|nr:hypothetical protein [Nitrospira sp.]
MDTKTGDEIVGSAQSAIGQTLDTLESDVDNAFGSAKHYLRNETQKIADNVFTRLIDYCEKQIPKQIPKIEAYISSHPWQILGGLMILGYLLSASKWTRQGSDAIRTR